jgi:hypothetical protein
MKPTLAAFALAISTTAALAQPPLQGVPEAPPPPPPSYQGETVEPEVTIIETEKSTIYEYRVHGQLYMVKVKPIVGPPYYLLDNNGDGVLDTQQGRVWDNSVPQWLLFSW